MSEFLSQSQLSNSDSNHRDTRATIKLRGFTDGQRNWREKFITYQPRKRFTPQTHPEKCTNPADRENI